MTERQSVRAVGRRVRRDRLIREREHDPYRERLSPPEPRVCPDCGAELQGRRWSWPVAPASGPSHLCPACRRVRDDLPAGRVTIRGEFAERHRDEVLGLAHNVEDRERAAHPMKRIMGISRDAGASVITTTEMNLAREIGHALRRAYGGTLHYAYTREASTLRVEWER